MADEAETAAAAAKGAEDSNEGLSSQHSSDAARERIEKIIEAVETKELEASTERLEQAVGETHKAPEREIGGLKFAPIKIPEQRRLQTAAVTMFWWYIPLSLVLFLTMLFVPICWVFLIPYCVFWLTDSAPEKGGRRIQWVRELKYFQYFCDYFPAVLIKEADLDPQKNYIFGYHPHGIISMGAFCHFNTEATKFSEKFPGIRVSLCTLASNFQYPLLRDFIMALGSVPVSRKSIEYILESGPGRSVAIVIGGARESLDARPKTADLTLERRKGFVKLALVHGSGLVPCFCFGENDLYKQLNDEKVRKHQEQFMKHMGFTLPVFWGRGIFQYNLGILPVRKPLVMVVGKPIETPRIPNPSAEDIEKYHNLYIDGLREIYDKYKDDFATDRKMSMRIVG